METTHLPTAASILIVDDDEGLETFLRKTVSIAAWRAHIDWATTVPEACDKLRTGNYDLVLADLFLPNLQFGTQIWNFSRQLKMDVPFAFMSGVKPEEYLSLFPKNAAPPFLAKPFHPKDCQWFLESLLFGTSSNYQGS